MTDLSSRISASIVVYNTACAELKSCVSSLHASGISRITVIDNSPTDMLRQACGDLGIRYIRPGQNLGYGAAHNIAMRESIADSSVDYHLVVNTDIAFEPEIIARMAAHLDSHAEIGQLSPRIIYPDGRLQYTVRLLPSPYDLILRRFLPSFVGRKRRRKYLLADWPHDTELNVAYHQGSFIMFRTKALQQVGLFDETFFMYPEDIDITRRIHRYWQTIYWPNVTVVHSHRRESYHSLRVLAIHIINMIRYFNKWGWINDSERQRVNRHIQEIIKSQK